MWRERFQSWRRFREVHAQQADPAHHRARHPRALRVEGVVARVAVARVEDQEKGQEGCRYARQLPRHGGHVDVLAVHVQVEEADVRREQQPHDRPAQHRRHDRPPPSQQHGELIEVGRVVRDGHGATKRTW